MYTGIRVGCLRDIRDAMTYRVLDFEILQLMRVNLRQLVLIACTTERVETLALLGELYSSRVRSQVAAGAKYGEFSSREKSHDLSPEKRRSKLSNASRRETLDKFEL